MKNKGKKLKRYSSNFENLEMASLHSWAFYQLAWWFHQTGQNFWPGKNKVPEGP